MINHIIEGETDILVAAYRQEKREIQKYSLALHMFDDERSQEFFDKLLKDETLHLKMIRKRIEEHTPKFFEKYDDREIFEFRSCERKDGAIEPVDFLKYSLFEEKSGALFHNLLTGAVKSAPSVELFRELEAAETAHINSIKYEIDFLSKKK